MNKEIPQPIRQDFLNGMSFTAIGRKYSIDPRTAKRHVINNLPFKVLEYEESGIYKAYISKPRDKKTRLEKILEEKQKMGGILK